MRTSCSYRRPIITLTMISLTFASCIFPSLADMQQTEREGIVHKLKSDDKNAREKAVEQLVDQRRATIKVLMELAGLDLQKNQAKGTSELAIDLLGEFRSAEAVDLLINRIDFSPMTLIWSDQKHAGYPCVNALIKIGKPASLGTIARLGSPDLTDTQRRLLLRVLNGVEGKNLAVFLLENARDHAETERTKKAYVTALSVLPDIKDE